MRARVQIIRRTPTLSLKSKNIFNCACKEEVVRDQTYKDKKTFKDCTRGCLADKIRLDVEIESLSDIIALIEWCDMAKLSLKND